MRKRKVKPNTFEDRAIARIELTKGPIDLKALWKAEEDKEADPKRIKELTNEA
jgi:hypothetical protein